MKDSPSIIRTITIHVPIRYRVRGGRKTVISDFVPPTPRPKINNTLLKALARAYRWRQQIESGEYASITELANLENVNASYACRLLRLTLLAPSIVHDVLNDRQGSDLTLKKLTKPFPTRWDEQVVALEQGTSLPLPI